MYRNVAVYSAVITIAFFAGAVSKRPVLTWVGYQEEINIMDEEIRILSNRLAQVESPEMLLEYYKLYKECD